MRTFEVPFVLKAWPNPDTGIYDREGLYIVNSGVVVVDDEHTRLCVYEKEDLEDGSGEPNAVLVVDLLGISRIQFCTILSGNSNYFGGRIQLLGNLGDQRGMLTMKMTLPVYQAMREYIVSLLQAANNDE